MSPVARWLFVIVILGGGSASLSPSKPGGLGSGVPSHGESVPSRPPPDPDEPPPGLKAGEAVMDRWVRGELDDDQALAEMVRFPFVATTGPYLIEGTETLRNKVGITDPGELATHQARITSLRITQLTSGRVTIPGAGTSTASSPRIAGRPAALSGPKALSGAGRAGRIASAAASRQREGQPCGVRRSGGRRPCLRRGCRPRAAARRRRRRGGPRRRPLRR